LHFSYIQESDLDALTLLTIVNEPNLSSTEDIKFSLKTTLGWQKHKLLTLPFTQQALQIF
jgi:hypothetical protein